MIITITAVNNNQNNNQQILTTENFNQKQIEILTPLPFWIIYPTRYEDLLNQLCAG
jgi:hypothetical protein